MFLKYTPTLTLEKTRCMHKCAPITFRCSYKSTNTQIYCLYINKLCKVKLEIVSRYLMKDTTLTTNAKGNSTITTNVRWKWGD